MKESLIPILLVDDEAEDIYFFKRAIESAGLPLNVQVAHNGLEAVNYLKQACENNDATAFPFPKVILTDNRMPVMSGREFLRWLSEHPRCRVIPTVVLGGSASPDDIQESYNLGAHSYFVKPMEPTALQDLVKMIFNYWTHAQVPPRPNAGDDDSGNL